MRGSENNLFSAIGSADWRTETPAFKEIAAFSVDAEECALSIQLGSETSFGVGKWVTETSAVPGWYNFSVVCRTKESIHDVYAIITVLRADGTWITREHARYEEKTDDGWRFTDDSIEVPEDGKTVRVELWLKGYTAQATWIAPTLALAEEPKPRLATLSVGYFVSKGSTPEEQVERILTMIDRCAENHPDIVLLTEAMYGRGLPDMKYPKRGETLDGPVIAQVRARAAQHHVYVVYNFIEREGTEYYNSSALIDRNGNVQGTYHKTHLTVSELEAGLTPGHEHKVFETDFAKIGLLTCFDQYFPEPATDLALKGAEIILIPTMGDAREKTSARARDGGIYVATAGHNSDGSFEQYGWRASRVVDPEGKILAQTNTDMDVITVTLDLAKRIRARWLSLGAAMSDVHGVYLREKNPKSYTK